MAYTNKRSVKRKHRQKRRTKKVGGVITYTDHIRARSASNKATKEEKAAEKAAQKAEKAAQKAEKTRLVTVKVADEVSAAAVNQAFSSMFGELYKETSPKLRKRK